MWNSNFVPGSTPLLRRGQVFLTAGGATVSVWEGRGGEGIILIGYCRPSLLGAKRGLAAVRTQWESDTQHRDSKREVVLVGGNNSPESPCEVGGYFWWDPPYLLFLSAGERSAVEGEAATAALEGDGLFFSATCLPKVSVLFFSFPPLYRLPTTQAELLITPPAGSRVSFCPTWIHFR